MLVLTRKSQDSIRIGDHIKVTILRIKGNTVRIGVEAPDDVRIVRGELPRFEDPVESSSGRTAPQVRELNRTDVDDHTIAGPESDQTAAHPGSSPQMSTSRRKPYLPSQLNDSQRSHPISGSRMPTDDMTGGGTHLPLPPR